MLNRRVNWTRRPSGLLVPNRSHPAASQLRALLPLHGTPGDISGYGRTFTPGSAITFPGGHRYGVVADFPDDASNGNIVSPSLQTLIGGALTLGFSIVCVVKVDSVTTREGFYYQGLDGGTNGVYVYHEGSTFYFSAIDWNNNRASIASSIGDWHNYVLTYDGTTLRVFQDGTEGTSATNASPTSREDSPLIGRAFADKSLDGQMALWAVFKGAIPRALARDLSINPWQLFAPRFIPFAGFVEAGATEINANRADLTFATYSAEVAEEVQANRADIQFSAYQASIAEALEANRADLTFATYAATVAEEVQLNRAEITFAAYQASIGANINANRAEIALTTYSAEVSEEVQANRADLTFDTYSATIIDLANVDAARADITFATYSAEIAEEVQAARADVTFDTYSSQIDEEVAANRAEITFTTYSGTVTGAVNITAVRAEISFETYQASIVGGLAATQDNDGGSGGRGRQVYYEPDPDYTEPRLVTDADLAQARRTGEKPKAAPKPKEARKAPQEPAQAPTKPSQEVRVGLAEVVRLADIRESAAEVALPAPEAETPRAIQDEEDALVAILLLAA